MRTRIVGLITLGLLLIGSMPLRAAEVYIHIYSSVILGGSQASPSPFTVMFGLRSALEGEGLCEGFPMNAFGGTLTNCDAVAPQGLLISFAQTVSWNGVLFCAASDLAFTSNPAVIVEATELREPIPFESGSLLVTDLALVSWSGGGVRFQESDPLCLEPNRSNDLANPWTASVCIDIVATYRDASGQELGQLGLIDLGLAPHCVSRSEDALFSSVPVEHSSWSRLKAEYE